MQNGVLPVCCVNGRNKGSQNDCSVYLQYGLTLLSDISLQHSEYLMFHRTKLQDS